MAKRTSASRAVRALSGPPALRGTPTDGRIAHLFVGQGHGFIRLPNEREVFFHRADVEQGSPFNELRVGDTVRFELFEDPVSGARALHVRRKRPR